MRFFSFQKHFLVLILLIGGGFNCAALGTQQNQEIGIQEIIEQWAVVERRFIEERFISGKAGTAADGEIFEDVYVFRNTLEFFLNSETYRIFRLAPIVPSTKSLFGRFTPNEIPEIHAAGGLALAFNDAVLQGDTEKALLISADISGSLVRSLIRSGEMEQFAYNAYLRLLLVFIVFIILTALVVMLLYGALGKSLKSEAESTWFSRAILLAQEEERSRISRELHDTVAQDLRSLSLGIDKIGNCPGVEERKKLCTSSESAHSALIVKVRDICNFLVPPDFRFQGLADALRRLCLDFGKRTGIDCRIDIAENAEPVTINEEKQLQIFRIVQEALTNVEKHAGASEAIVILRGENDGIISAGISDDGKGFDSDGEKGMDRIGHLGIRGMKERAKMLGGNLEIKSERGEGTLVRLEIPIENKESE